MSISKAEFLRTLQRYKAAQDNALSGITMPVAGASTLGGVKVGAGLSMVGDTLTVVWDNFSLDTTPSTVEGAMWYDNSGSSPVVYMRCSRKRYSLSPSFAPEDPQLTVTPSAVTITAATSPTATVSYSGNGTVSVSDYYGVASYNSNTRVITFRNTNLDSHLIADGFTDAYVTLAAAGAYQSAQATVHVEVYFSPTLEDSYLEFKEGDVISWQEYVDLGRLIFGHDDSLTYEDFRVEVVDVNEDKDLSEYATLDAGLYEGESSVLLAEELRDYLPIVVTVYFDGDDTYAAAEASTQVTE